MDNSREEPPQEASSLDVGTYFPKEDTDYAASDSPIVSRDLENGNGNLEAKAAELTDGGGASDKETAKDPYLVEWDGPDDPENPMNWSYGKKWLVTLMMGMMTFCVTFASSVFSNATMPVAKEYGVSTVVSTLGTSLFVLGFAFGPLVSNASPLRKSEFRLKS
jgi:hypothetical protein